MRKLSPKDAERIIYALASFGASVLIVGVKHRELGINVGQFDCTNVETPLKTKNNQVVRKIN